MNPHWPTCSDDFFFQLRTPTQSVGLNPFLHALCSQLRPLRGRQVRAQEQAAVARSRGKPSCCSRSTGPGRAQGRPRAAGGRPARPGTATRPGWSSPCLRRQLSWSWPRRPRCMMERRPERAGLVGPGPPGPGGLPGTFSTLELRLFLFGLCGPLRVCQCVGWPCGTACGCRPITMYVRP